MRPKKGLLNKIKHPFPNFALNTVEKTENSFVDKIKNKALLVIKKSFGKILGVIGKIIGATWELMLIVITFVLVCMMLMAIMGAFGAFQGKIVVNMDKFQTLNQDKQVYMDAQNTNELRKSYYQLVSETSYYQMFNLRDMNPDSINPFLRVMQGITNDVLPDSFGSLTDEDLSGINKKLMDSQGFLGQNNLLGLLGFDQRYIYSDANKNALKYMKSAKVIGIEKVSGKNEKITQINDYFRDYYNREQTFMLSETLLSEMNRTLFGEFKNAESVVYPEAFTKPVPFVNDFYRVQTDSKSTLFGEPYVYVTQRVGQTELTTATSPYYGKTWLEGIIYTKPSKIIYDYAVTSKNIYHWSDATNDTAKQINFGNVSQYATSTDVLDYGDGTTEDVTKAIKLYWIVKDSEDGTGTTFNKTTYSYGNVNGMNPYNEHMTAGINNTTYTTYFDGPYTRLLKNGNSITVDPSSKIADNKFLYLDGTGNSVDATKGTKVRQNLNIFPTRHLQLAPMYNEQGKVSINSRVLFNKTFVQKKSIKESYRNFPEYYAQFATFVDTDTKRLPPAAGLTAILDTDTLLAGSQATYCTADMWDKDQKKPFQQRQCSILRKYTGTNGLAWMKGKFSEMGAAITNAVTGENKEAELGVSSQAMFYILKSYEDYLIETGEYGVVWDYKYYTASEFDLALAKVQYMDVFGWKEVYLDSWNDKGVYKDTLDTVKALDKAKTIQTQYVPTAIISGEVAAPRDGNVNINNIGYGWRIKAGADLSNPASNILERVAGEASLEYPVYSTGKMADILDKYLYGSIVYGQADFKYKWDSTGKIIDKGDAEIQQYYNSLDTSTDEAKALKDELISTYKSQDYRNKDLVWNPDTAVYRPTVTGVNPVINTAKILDNITSSITKVDSALDGKVTYRTGPTDNLPLEVKSVRDYGLGSVLSYLEGLRVVYQAGVFMDETYSKSGLEQSFNSLGISNFSKYKEGYYPKALLDKYPQLLTDMRTTPMSIEDLSAFAQNVISLQYAATDEEFDGTNNQKELMTKISQRNANGLQITGLDLGYQGFKIADNGKTVGSNICRSCATECASETDPTANSRCLNTCRSEGGYFNDNLQECTTRCKTTRDNSWNVKDGDSLVGDAKTKLEDELQKALDTCSSKCATDWPDRSQTCSNVDTSAAGAVYAYSPYLTPNYLDQIGSKLFGWAGYDTMEQVQFLDPLQYYIEWFDYFANRDNFLDKALSFISGKNLVSELDSNASSTLRAVQNDPSKGFNNISSSYFGNAGTHIVGKFKEDFYNKYTTNIQPYKLISESETYKVYMIEEAVTFLGTFTYTYKDDIVNLGTGGGNTQVISMAYADRNYYMSNYIFSLPYLNYVAEGFKTVDSGWVSSPPTCPSAATVASDAESHYNGKTWYNPFTWLDTKLEIADTTVKCKPTTESYSCGCTPKGGCSTCYRYRLQYDEVASVGRKIENVTDGSDAMRLDTPLEISTLLANSSDATLRNRVMLQMKVYDSLSDWSWSINSNQSTDFKTKLTHDYDANYVSGAYYSGDNDNHYTSLKAVNSNIGNRTGYTVNSADKSLVDGKNLPDDLNMDINYDSGAQAPVKMTASDLTTILETAKKVDAKKVKATNFSTGSGSVNIKTGIQLSDTADNIGVGLLIANREAYGYPIPLFRHFSGAEREILPRQKGSYFNGETLESWQTRLVITTDSSVAKMAYVDNEKYNLQNYLYGYITNFETYVPFDVKSDYDLMSRGREAYNSTDVSTTSDATITSVYAGEISTLTDTPAWKETIEKFNASNGKVTQNTVSQIIAGLIEVQMSNVPIRAIKILNSKIPDATLKIKTSSENQAVISAALKLSATDTSATVANRKVKLTLENGDSKEFDTPFYGAGAIFYDYNQFGNTSLSTEAIAPGQVCGAGKAYTECFKIVALNIKADKDDRLTRQMSIEYVSSKFGKLLRKYGDTPKAIMAYFYGEAYTDVLVKQAGTMGKGSNWSNSDDKVLIAATLKELTSAGSVVVDADKVDISMYTSTVIAKTMSYVKDVSSKTTLTTVAVVPANATGVEVGSKADIGQTTYNKWAGHINSIAPEYKVDAAVWAAILTQESDGNSYSGLCSGDSITTDTMMGTRKCTKLSHDYNGGGGAGQIHHFCDNGSVHGSSSGGQLTSGTCTRTVKSSVTGKSIVVREAIPSEHVNSISDVAAFEAIDDRYGNVDLAFEWSIAEFSNLLDIYDNDIYKALVGYNAGGGTVNRFVKECGEGGWYNCYANSPAYGKKANYVHDVMRYYNKALSTNDLKFSGTSTSLSSMLDSGFQLKTGEIHYNKDLFSYQNSGVELFKPSLSIGRDDVKMLLMNNYNFGKDLYDPYANKYNLMSLFTQRKVYDTSGADGAGQAWVGMSATIDVLGQKSARTVPANYIFAYIPPLIQMNSPTGKPVSQATIINPFGLSVVGAGEMNNGLDFGIPTGTPIYASAPGRVTTAAFDGANYGWYVKIEHILPDKTTITSSDGKKYEVVKLYTTYAHNTSLKVAVGDVVSDDCTKITSGARCISIKDPIALSGSTGKSTAPNLHFEIDMIIKDLTTGKEIPYTSENKNVDPLYWLTTTWKTVGNLTGNAVTTAQIETIMTTIKQQYPNLSPARQSVVSQALSLVGNVPYFWGGGHGAVYKGVNPDWDHVYKTVTSSGSHNSGKSLLDGLDCSGFTRWSMYNGTGVDMGGGNAASQRDLGKSISKTQLQPGDFGNFSDDAHVGIYLYKDANGNPVYVHDSSSKNRVVTGNVPGFSKFYTPKGY